MCRTETIWLLLAKKLTGEATEAELIEFSEMAEKLPEVKDHLQLLSAFWKNNRSMDERNRVEESEAAYERHCQRMGKAFP
jgi:hypothetical protein